MKEKLHKSILLLLLFIAFLGFSVFLIYKAFYVEWGSFFLILFGVVLGFISIAYFFRGFLELLPTPKNKKRWKSKEQAKGECKTNLKKQNLYKNYDEKRNKLIEISEKRYLNDTFGERTKKVDENEEWNRLDELYDEHFSPGFDPF